MKTWTLREARRRAGFTQDALAAASGVKQSTISSYECGTRLRPAYDNITRLARALRIAPSELRFPKPDAESVAVRNDRVGPAQQVILEHADRVGR